MTDELKKALESAQTEEEKKAVVEEHKNQLRELSPEELEGVAGGMAVFCGGTERGQITGIPRGSI